MITGLFTQEGSGVGNPVWESIPMSIQTLVGVAAIMGAGWTWFVRPRMVALVAEAVDRGNSEWRKSLAATRDELRADFSTKIDSTRDELRGEIAATRKDLSEEIAATRGELATRIDSTRKDLSAEIAATRDELRVEIATTRDELRGEIAASRKDLSEAIAVNRGDIAKNRDSITDIRDLISASRIETRDLLADMQRENHLAHAAIGDRIGGVQMLIAQESKILWTKIAELGTDTARLAGAVDVLTSIWQEGDMQGEIRTQ